MGWVVSFLPLPLYLWKKSPRCQMNRRLGGLQSRSGCFGEAHNFFFLPGIEPRYLGVPVCNLFSIPIGQCIRKIHFFSNLNPVNRVSWGFSWFYSFAPSKYQNSRSIMRRLLLSKLLSTQLFIPQSSCQLTLPVAVWQWCK